MDKTEYVSEDERRTIIACYDGDKSFIVKATRSEYYEEAYELEIANYEKIQKIPEIKDVDMREEFQKGNTKIF